MQRRVDIDGLRIGAVLLVFVVHAAQVFSPIDDWHIRSAESSWVLGQFTVFFAPWLIPLFMLLAGQSAWFLLRKGDTSRFLKERGARLLVPLVAGTLLVVPPQVWLRRVSRGEFEGGYLSFYPRFFDGFFPEGNFSYGHLWFLAYLLVYALAGLPFLRLLQADGGRRVLSALARVAELKGGVLLFALPLALGQILLRVPFTQTTGAVVGDWATHAWLFPVYLMGFAMMLEPRIEGAVARDWRWALVPGVAASAGIALWAAPGDVYARLPSEFSAGYLVFWTGFMLATWSWLVVLSGAARAVLTRPNSFIRYWGDRVYPFYVFHQTVIVVVAFHVVTWPLGVWPAFAAVVSICFVLTLAVLEATARVAPLRALLGLRRVPPPVAAVGATVPPPSREAPKR